MSALASSQTAEAADDGVQIGKAGRERGQTRRGSSNHPRRQRSPAGVVDRQTQREERILQLVRETPRQLLPGGDAFGLTVCAARPGYSVERLRELADLRRRTPPTGHSSRRRNLPRGIGDLLDRSRCLAETT